MNIKEIAKKIAELHYPYKPNTILDETYRQIRMKTLRQQVEAELNNCFIPVSNRRELLLEYEEWINDYPTKKEREQQVDKFLNKQ